MLLLSTRGRNEGGSRGTTRRRHGHGTSAEHCGDRDGGGFLENPLPLFFFSIFLLNFKKATFANLIEAYKHFKKF